VENKMRQKDANCNYLVFLIDMYQREALYNHYKHRKKKETPQFNISIWQTQNAHFEELRNLEINGEKADEISAAAVTSYLGRVAPKLILKTPSQIDYDLKGVAAFIEHTTAFVHNKATTEQSTCPFQYDAVFVFAQSVAEEEVDDDDEDDDDDDGGDKSNGDDDDKKFTKSEVPKDVKQILDAADLNNKAVQWDGTAAIRDLKGAYDEVRNNSEEEQFPQFTRFCSILDFRADEEKEDNLFVFEPEDGSKKIHKNAMALNYVQNSRRSVLPNPDSKDDEDSQLLTAMTTGPQFMLSFQVEAADNMRCYLYINGQFTRFLPEDLKMMLPNFFVQSEDNEKFTESDELKEMIERMKEKLIDVRFRAFLKASEVKCPFEEENK